MCRATGLVSKSACCVLEDLSSCVLEDLRSCVLEPGTQAVERESQYSLVTRSNQPTPKSRHEDLLILKVQHLVTVVPLAHIT